MAGDTELEVLRSIDSKLGALLTITLDNYVRTHNVAGAHPVSIDVMLSNAGLSSNEIATMLGKTPRAVNAAIQSAKAKKRNRPTKQ
jgi:hypothetical protein